MPTSKNLSYKTVLNLLRVSCIAIGLIGLTYGASVLCLPLDQFDDVPVDRERSLQADRKLLASEAHKVTLADFGNTLEKRLQARSEKHVATAEPAQPPTVVMPTLQIDLLGTAVMDDYRQSTAWIRTTDARTLRISEGDIIQQLPGTPSVKQIQSRRVVFDFGGTEVPIEMAKEPNRG